MQQAVSSRILPAVRCCVPKEKLSGLCQICKRLYSESTASNDDWESCLRKKIVRPKQASRRSRSPKPPDPLTCCGSGCENCVWIEYGTQVMHYYSDRPVEDALREIDRHVENIGLREFIKAEIRSRAKYRSH